MQECSIRKEKMAVGQEKKSPIVAALLGIVPGLGHFYLKDVFTGVLYLVVFWLGGLFALWVFVEWKYPLWIWGMLVGLIWLYGIYDAYRDCIRHNQKIGAE